MIRKRHKVYVIIKKVIQIEYNDFALVLIFRSLEYIIYELSHFVFDISQKVYGIKYNFFDLA